jgi:hypothetical protein
MAASTLMAKIDAMYDDGTADPRGQRLIRGDIRDCAHEVRYLANDAAHRDFAEPVPQPDHTRLDHQHRHLRFSESMSGSHRRLAVRVPGGSIGSS